jgi:hypothetical protein
MQRKISTNQRDAPGQDTGRSQGHLSTYLLGGALGERHRARCKTDSRGCDTHCGGLDERPTQNLRSTGQETHRATVGSPGQTWNATMTRNQLAEKKADGKEPRNTHHRAPSLAEPMKKSLGISHFRHWHRGKGWASDTTPAKLLLEFS